MESVLGRYRNLIILLGVLFLQALGLAVQVRRSAEAENTRLIRIWAVSVITPLERVLVWAQHGTGDLWHNYFYLRGVRAENRQLKEQLEQMHLEQVRLSEDAAQAHRLQALLGFKEQFIAKTVAAQVIGSSGTDLSRSIYLDKGSDSGIQPEMAVITSDGIVGKVLRVYPSTCLVLLINDQSSGVGAVLEKARLQGVLRGTANGELALDRVMTDEQVPLGETILTSGGDQIFPKGLPIGTVAKVAGEKELFLNIQVKPAANLGKLEEVLVIVQKQERQVTTEDTARVRAADILAQRLPSVPDKPATMDGKVSGSLPAGSAPPAAAGVTGIKPQSPPRIGNRPAGTAAVKTGRPVGSNATVTKRSPDSTLPEVPKTNDTQGRPADSQGLSGAIEIVGSPTAQPQEQPPAQSPAQTSAPTKPAPPPASPSPAPEDSPH